jgi:hypothetical protein
MSEALEREHIAEMRELNCREDCDHRVQLMWKLETNSIYIALFDKKHNIMRTVRVPNGAGLHAFDHPFVYMR